MAAIGKVLREARLRLGLSQAAVARRAGMTASQLSHIEVGQSASPEFVTVSRIAAALQLSLDDVASKSGVAGFGKPARRGPSLIAESIETMEELTRIERSARDAAEAALNLTKRLSHGLPRLEGRRAPKKPG